MLEAGLFILPPEKLWRGRLQNKTIGILAPSALSQGGRCQHWGIDIQHLQLSHSASDDQ